MSIFSIVSPTPCTWHVILIMYLLNEWINDPNPVCHLLIPSNQNSFPSSPMTSLLLNPLDTFWFPSVFNSWLFPSQNTAYSYYSFAYFQHPLLVPLLFPGPLMLDAQSLDMSCLFFFILHTLPNASHSLLLL